MSQWQFDFKDWEQAFELYYRRKIERREPVVFVISTASYTSGYWIEGEDAKGDAQTKVYRTVRQVRALERRIRKARDKTVNLSVGGLVV